MLSLVCLSAPVAGKVPEALPCTRPPPIPCLPGHMTLPPPLLPPAAKKTGRAVALSVNLPSGEPLMRAWAEKRLLQELQALQLVRRGAVARAGGQVLPC